MTDPKKSVEQSTQRQIPVYFVQLPSVRLVDDFRVGCGDGKVVVGNVLNYEVNATDQGGVFVCAVDYVVGKENL